MRTESLLLSPADQRLLLQTARQSIRYGLTHGTWLPVDLSEFPATLQQPGAAFVTLEKQKQLRGCIGSIEAHRPLVEDVSINAWNAAFRDPRFTELADREFNQIVLEISVLTAPETLNFSSEADLKQQLVPGRDGVILQEGFQRGLFLPAVWKQLPNPNDFWEHLKQKAGFHPTYWSDRIQAQRFYSFEFSEEEHGSTGVQ
jgi:AmmeMemoRadiSam system protein A